MSQIAQGIDVTVTRNGRLVLLAEGASSDRSLVVRTGRGNLEIADGGGVLARAPISGAATAAVAARRIAEVVLIGPGGDESLHAATICLEE